MLTIDAMRFLMTGTFFDLCAQCTYILCVCVCVRVCALIERNNFWVYLFSEPFRITQKFIVLEVTRV